MPRWRGGCHSQYGPSALYLLTPPGRRHQWADGTPFLLSAAQADQLQAKRRGRERGILGAWGEWCRTSMSIRRCKCGFTTPQFKGSHKFAPRLTRNPKVYLKILPEGVVQCTD